MVAVKMFWEVDMGQCLTFRMFSKKEEKISKTGSWECQAVKKVQKTVCIEATGYSAAKMSHQSCPTLG